MMAYKSNIFIIDPEVEKRIHPEALRVLSNWEEVELGMLQTELTAADIDEYLEDNEKAEFQRCMNQIWDGLKTCMDVGDGVTLYDVYIGDIFLTKGIISQFQRTSLVPLFSLKLLLKKACDQKLKKVREKERQEAEEAREKQRREEEEEKRKSEEAREEEKKQQEKTEAEEKDRQWDDAHKVVKPPLDDAERYLNDEEYDSFIKAGREAIKVYLEKKEDYLADSRTFDYRQCLWKINYRKEEERQKIAADFAAKEYNRRLNEERERLKALLYSSEKNTASYFKNHTKDARYTGESLSQFLDSEEIEAFDKKIEDSGRSRVAKLVNNDFQGFFYAKYYRSYFLLPSAEYSFEGVPCLDFVFDVFAVVEARVWLKPSPITFGDYTCKLPWREENGSFVPLQGAEFLGYDYVVLTPKDIGGYIPWESIPLVLIKGLMNGELQPAGTTILAASENGRTYRIKNFKEEVTIPRSFESYLKEIGNIDQMVSMGIMTQEVADIMQANLTEAGAAPTKQATAFTDEDLISSLTSLGYARKASEELCSRVPRNLSLDEAIKFALNNQREIIGKNQSEESK